MPPASVKPRPEGWRFQWDIVVFVAFVVVTMRHATGLPWHEVIGVAVIPVLAIHLWLNWRWITEVALRPPRGLAGEGRFNRYWDRLQFAVVSVALGTGLAVSQTVLPALGLHAGRSHFLEDVHGASANVLVAMIGVHLGMHAHWIWSKIRGTAAAATAARGESFRGRRPVILAAALIAMVTAAVLVPRLDIYRQHRSVVGRFERDFESAAALMGVPALLTFGVIVCTRRKKQEQMTRRL